MIRFTMRQLFKNGILLAWPLLAITFVLIALLFGTNEATGSNSFVITFTGSLSMDSSMMTVQLFSIIWLIAMISLPTHLVENLQPGRASLIFSKPLSRSNFFIYDIAGMLLITSLYSLFTAFVLGLYVVFTASVFPVQFLIATLCIPLYMLALYAAINLMVVLTDSYMASVFIVFALQPISMMLFSFDELMPASGEILKTFISVLNYVIPSTGAAQSLISKVLNTASFDPVLAIHVLISTLPFFLISYYIMSKKEF